MSQPAQLVFLSDYNVGTTSFVQRIINGKVMENKSGRAKVVRHTFNTHFQALDKAVTVQVYDVEGKITTLSMYYSLKLMERNKLF